MREQKNISTIRVPLAGPASWFVSWLIIDCIIVFLAYITAFSVYANQPEHNTIKFAVFSAASMLGTLYIFGIYRRIWARTSGHDITLIIRAILVATAISAVTPSLLAVPHAIPLAVILLGNAIALIGIVMARYRSRLISGLIWRWEAVWHHEFPQMPTRVLIVGAGEAGQTTAWRLKYRCPEPAHYCVVGFMDDNPAKQGMYVEGCPVFGPCSDIPRCVAAYNIDLIVVAIHNISGPAFRQILGYCEQTNARVKVLPDMFSLIDSTCIAPLLRDIQPEDLLGRKAINRHQSIDPRPITGKVILVTGAAGSIGSELCRQLLAYAPIQLILLDNNESGLHDLYVDLKSSVTDAVLQPALVDITNRTALNVLFAHYRPHVVFHSAAYKHVPMLESFPYEAIRVNIGGTQHVAELARQYGVERFVLISTDKAVHPTSIMGASKRICELLIHALARQSGYRTRFTSVRFGNVLGSRGSVVPIFNRQIDSGGPVTVTHPDMTRYFMTISEAANLVIQAACLTHDNELFMLNMGNDVRIVELAERMIRLRGLRPHQDIKILYSGIRPGEKLHEDLYDSLEMPTNTPHPGILQLKSCPHNFKPNDFLAQITHLLSADDIDHSIVRNHLLALLNGSTYFTPLAAEDVLAQTKPITSIASLLNRHPAGLTTTWPLFSSDGELLVSPELIQKYLHHCRCLASIHHTSPLKRAVVCSALTPPPAYVYSGSPNMNIPMSSPDINQSDIDAVLNVLNTNWLSLGPKLEQFEGAFSAYVGTQWGIGVNSGTSGLHLAMIALGLQPGDEVITSSFSFIASANCVVYERATPVFVDIDPLTGNLDPALVEAAITERTRAIIPVHVFGQPVDMDPILLIARQHNLSVIEDACEAIGAEYKGRRAGTLADAAVFAFYPNKQMTTGEGGMIVTNNQAWATLFYSLRNQGRDVFDAWLCHSRLGYNYRMDEMSAALGTSQLMRIDDLLAKRARVAEWYNQRIDEIHGLNAPFIEATTTRMSWFVYVVRCTENVNRNKLMEYLKSQGVPSRPYFTPIHLQPFYQDRFGWQRDDLPHTEHAGDTFLALPFSSIMTEEQVEYVCHQLRIGVEHIRDRKNVFAGLSS